MFESCFGNLKESYKLSQGLGTRISFSGLETRDKLIGQAYRFCKLALGQHLLFSERDEARKTAYIGICSHDTKFMTIVKTCQHLADFFLGKR